MLYSSAELVQPLFNLIQEPVTKFDNFLCKTLDFVELKVPSLYMPPELVRSFFFTQNDSVGPLENKDRF